LATERSAGDLSRLAGATWSIARRIHVGTKLPGNWVKLFKFGAVGASGYVINLAIFATLTGLGVHHVGAAIGAFCIAVTNNFFWNRFWTFRDSAGERGAGFQAVRFFAVSVFALGLNLVVLVLLVDVFGLPPVPGQAIAVAVAMPANFIGNKMWTFGWNLTPEPEPGNERAGSRRQGPPDRPDEGL
jgi:dolichol-phosphate mannosyltransferase